VLDAFSGMYPPEAGFNDAQWAKEQIKRFVRKTVARYETMVAQQAAVVPEDNDIVDVT